MLKQESHIFLKRNAKNRPRGEKKMVGLTLKPIIEYIFCLLVIREGEKRWQICRV